MSEKDIDLENKVGETQLPPGPVKAPGSNGKGKEPLPREIYSNDKIATATATAEEQSMQSGSIDTVEQASYAEEIKNLDGAYLGRGGIPSTQSAREQEAKRRNMMDKNIAGRVEDIVASALNASLDQDEVADMLSYANQREQRTLGFAKILPKTWRESLENKVAQKINTEYDVRVADRWVLAVTALDSQIQDLQGKRRAVLGEVLQQKKDMNIAYATSRGVEDEISRLSVELEAKVVDYESAIDQDKDYLIPAIEEDKMRIEMQLEIEEDKLVSLGENMERVQTEMDYMQEDESALQGAIAQMKQIRGQYQKVAYDLKAGAKTQRILGAGQPTATENLSFVDERVSDVARVKVRRKNAMQGFVKSYDRRNLPVEVQTRTPYLGDGAESADEIRTKELEKTRSFMASYRSGLGKRR